jgi:tetratricopeptide (TPR) repeat protein
MVDLYQNSILFRQNRDVTDKMSNKDRIAELQAANQQAEADGDLGAHGELLNSLGLALKDAGRFNESETAFRESLQVVDQFMEALHRARAQVHSNLGLLSRDRGDLDDAVSLYQQAQREYETIGDDAGAAGMLVEAGIVHKDASRLSEAIACLQRWSVSGWSSNGDTITTRLARIMNEPCRSTDAMAIPQMRPLSCSTSEHCTT